MRIVIEADLLRSDAANDERHRQLLALFQLGTSHVHTIEVERQGAVAFEIWLHNRDPQTRRACVAAIQAGQKRLARTAMRRLYVADIDVSAWKTNRLTLADAYRFLQQPLVVLLENAVYDRNFLEVISRIASNGRHLRKLLDDGHVKVAAFGGVESNKQWIQDNRRRPEELARLWVLSDSDAKRPWRERTSELREHLNPSVRQLAEECQTRHVPIYVLTRRAIENYLPIPALRAWGKRRERVDALEALRPEQRHHYHMKRGFDGDRKNAFYTDVPEHIMQALDRGIDDSVAELFSGQIVYMQGHWLLRDQQQKEAQTIVNSILEHL
jgi:hypothetical protein